MSHGIDYGDCLECKNPCEYETDIDLCESCMKKFDMDRLWKMHDNRELDALDFNESASMRERFKI